MSLAPCSDISISFCAATVNINCLKEGYAPPPFDLVFKNRLTGAEVDITADDFVMFVKNAAGGTVDTLTIGDGLTIVPNNRLRIQIESPVTDAAGVYSHTIVWKIQSVSPGFPAFQGKIIVKV